MLLLIIAISAVLLCCSQPRLAKLGEPACTEDECPMPDDIVESPQATGLFQQLKNTAVTQVDVTAPLQQPENMAVAHVKDVEPSWPLQLLSSWFSWCSWWSWFSLDDAKPKPHKPKLAVLIAGLAERLVLAPKIRRIMEPTVASGWDVDLYLSVVGMDKGNHKAWHPIENNESAVVAENLETVAAIQTLADAGGWTIRFCELDGDSQEVASSFPRDMPVRLRLYPPASSEIGMNVLKRFKTTELLMHKLQDVETVNGFSYDFVLVTKDDDHWLRPLDISRFLAEPLPPTAVYSKNCLGFGGVNDKTLLFGRQAAEAVLPRLYSDFWMKDQRLVTNNIESLWKGIISIKGMRSRPVDFELLPTCDSIYLRRTDGTPYLCQKKCYMCREYALLKNDGRFEQPEFCPE